MLTNKTNSMFNYIIKNYRKNNITLIKKSHSKQQANRYKYTNRRNEKNNNTSEHLKDRE